MVRVHFGPPLQKDLNRSQDREDRGPKASKPKWTRKAALGNSPVDCCNRRGFPAGKRVLGPPLLLKGLTEAPFMRCFIESLEEIQMHLEN